jgi:hypothetical protein
MPPAEDPASGSQTIGNVKRSENYGLWRRSQVRITPGVVYRGVVLDNVDPEQLGRVKVIIEAITPTAVSAKDAKWAWTMNVFGGGQVNGQRYGAFFPYPIGAKVFVLFEQNDQGYNSPIVIGGWYQSNRIPTDKYDRKQEGKSIPAAWGWRSPKGHVVHTREEDGEESIELISMGGRKIVISDKKDQEMISMIGKKGGEILLREGKEGTVLSMMDPKGDSITIDEKTKSINVQAGETINLMAKNVNLIGTTQLSQIAKDVIISGTISVSCAGLVQSDFGNISSLTNVDGVTITNTATAIENLAVTINSVAGATISSTSTGLTSIVAGGAIGILSGSRIGLTSTNVGITAGVILVTGFLISKP